jgi:hypothetical protein
VRYRTELAEGVAAMRSLRTAAAPPPACHSAQTMQHAHSAANRAPVTEMPDTVRAERGCRHTLAAAGRREG